MSIFDALFGGGQPVTVEQQIQQEPIPTLYSLRVREVKYGSGITDYYLEKYNYPEYNPQDPYHGWRNYKPYWHEVKKYHSEALAKKAYNDLKQEQYNNSIISDKVIWP